MVQLVGAEADRLRPGLIDLARTLIEVPATHVATDIGPLWLPAYDTVMAPWIAYHGTWEPEESVFLRSRLEPGMTLVDIGANVGYFSVLGSQCVGPLGTVVAIEPEPTNYALLCANLWEARAGNVDPIRAAASSVSGPLTFSVSRENCGDHRSFLERPAGQTLEVAGVRVDELFDAEARVDVIKIDIQGADHRAVVGMEGLVARSRPLLLVEFWPRGIEELGDRPIDVLSYYRSLGLNISLLASPGVDTGVAADPQLVATVAASESGFTTIVLTASEDTSTRG